MEQREAPPVPKPGRKAFAASPHHPPGYLSICDAMNVGIGLGIPVLFLGLQVMIASNHIPAFGMFPLLGRKVFQCAREEKTI